jgi:hypothetical protein
MFLVDDIFDEAKKVIGVCSDTILFSWLGDAVSLIANKGDFEGWKGTLDICTSCSCSSGCSCEGGKCVTLPREVETVLAVNIGGRPTLGVGQLFNFHLNGPGDCKVNCDWQWQDLGHWHCTLKDLSTPSKLVAYLRSDEDDGKKLIVYGVDHRGNVLRRQEGGVWKDGYQVPTIYGVAVPDSEAPTIGRITGIYKDRTVAEMRLSTIDDSGPTGTLLGVYQPDEQVPQYRRIKLNRCSPWVRIAYQKSNPTFSSRYDHVPLQSRLALLLAVKAVKHYSESDLPSAHAFEVDAARLELEAQQRLEAITYNPIQVVDMNSPRDKSDYDIR